MIKAEFFWLKVIEKAYVQIVLYICIMNYLWVLLFFFYLLSRSLEVLLIHLQKILQIRTLLDVTAAAIYSKPWFPKWILAITSQLPSLIPLCLCHALLDLQSHFLPFSLLPMLQLYRLPIGSSHQALFGLKSSYLLLALLKHAFTPALMWVVATNAKDLLSNVPLQSSSPDYHTFHTMFRHIDDLFAHLLILGHHLSHHLLVMHLGNIHNPSYLRYLHL